MVTGTLERVDSSTFSSLNAEVGASNGCKSDKEITDWLSSKMLLLAYNEIRFDHQKYHKRAMVP